jgi:hypothetical protein
MELSEELHIVSLNFDISDSDSWALDKSSQYTTKSLYRFLIVGE